MQTSILTVTTGSRPTVRDLTGECTAFLTQQAAADGLLNVFVPHATAGVVIMETGAGSDIDLLTQLEHLLPTDARWQHRHGSPGHGRDHLAPALLAASVTVPVLAGAMALGTWQSVCLVDTNGDNPTRTVRLTLLPG